MVDRVIGHGPPAVIVERLACIGINVKAREIAAGDIEADTMPAPEDQGSRVHFDRERVHFARLH